MTDLMACMWWSLIPIGIVWLYLSNIKDVLNRIASALEEQNDLLHGRREEKDDGENETEA